MQDDQLRAIVQRMVQRGEDETAIAEVVRNYDAQIKPAPSPPPKPATMSDLMDAAMRSKGFERTPSEREMSNRIEEGVMGGGVATAAPAAVGNAVQFAPQVSAALRSGAERMYGGLLKAKDATIERFPNVIKDLLAARVPISHGGRRRVIEGLRKVGDEKQSLLAAADQRAMVPRETLRAGLDDVLDGAIQNSETPVKDMGKLAKIERELLPDEPGVLPSRADRMKSKLQAESDRTYRQMKMGTRVTDTGARAKAGIANRAKEAVEAIEPKMRDVNARYGSGKGQAEALRGALKRTDKHSVIGMSDLIGAGVGSAVGGPGGGAAGVALMKILSHPNSGSRGAILMNEAARIPHLDQVAKAVLMSLLAEQE